MKLESLSENISYYVLANNTNGSSTLSLDALACSEVLISYATVSVLGRSAFSPATNVCIAEGIVYSNSTNVCIVQYSTNVCIVYSTVQMSVLQKV